ncbi:MAG: response regulator transcription factor, partial [Verrucomicrobiales bacterium]
DDHEMMRAVLSRLIDTEDDLEICGAAGTVAEALSLFRSKRPDLVITDLSLPDRSGFDLIKEMKFPRNRQSPS